MVRRSVVATLVFIGLTSCGSGNHAAPAFSLSSPAFLNGKALPASYSCDGGKLPPALSWSAPPSGTKSLVLILDDPDAPGATFGHWGLYDIPPTARSLSPQNVPDRNAANDFGNFGYGAPCPPRGDKPHHYRFKLYALDVDHLDLGPNPNVAEVDSAAQRHATGRAELIGVSQRR